MISMTTHTHTHNTTLTQLTVPLSIFEYSALNNNVKTQQCLQMNEYLWVNCSRNYLFEREPRAKGGRERGHFHRKHQASFTFITLPI